MRTLSHNHESMHQAQPAAAQAAAQAAPQAAPQVCFSEQELNIALGTLQARLTTSEKHAAVMEKRVFAALRECHDRPLTPPGGCSWSLFVFTVVIFGAVLFFSLRRSAAPAAMTSGPFPLVLPGSLPGSPMVLGGGPTAFMSH